MPLLRLIVAASDAFMAPCYSKFTGCSSISSEVIHNELFWDKAIYLQQLAHRFERRPIAPPGLDKIIEERKAATDPEAIHRALKGYAGSLHRVGLEARSFSPWLSKELSAMGLPAIVIEAVHMQKALWLSATKRIETTHAVLHT